MDKKDIPILILAGGQGTRLAEETTMRPKPLVEIGGHPILWHIMMYYSQFGFNNFVVCAGYLSNSIKEYFTKLHWHDQSVEFNYENRNANAFAIINQHHSYKNWRVRVLETGPLTMTGGRVARALDIIDLPAGAHFGLTYGDGLCNVDLNKELASHLESGKTGTVLGVHPMARFGVLEVDSYGSVSSFAEKPQTGRDLINGGFFFFKRDFASYLKTDESCILEHTPLEKLAQDGQLGVYRHEGFWQCMDTIRDKHILQSEWESPDCAWRIWS